MFYQQVGRVAAKDGYITEQDYKEIEKITSFNKFASLYVEDYADSIKHFLRFGGYGDFYTENKWNYFELWKRVGFNNPKLYIEAFIAQTRFWYNSGYDKWVVYNDNIPSVTPYFQDLLPTFPEKAHPYLQAFLKLKPFVSVGLHTWVLFVLTIVSFIKKDKKILLLIPFLTLLLTLILRFWTVANIDYPGMSPYIHMWIENSKEPMMSEMKQDIYLKAFLSTDITKAVGLNSWVLGGLYVKGRLRRERETLILVPYIVLLLTNIFLAPVPEFRYMLPLFFVLPIIFAIFMQKKNCDNHSPFFIQE